jgi:hypothetical protein
MVDAPGSTNSRNCAIPEGNVMSENNEKQKDACTIDATDSQGNPNLCCCYVMDPDGRYLDPCYHPVDDCCVG